MTTTPLERLTPAQVRIVRALHESGWLYKRAAERLGMPEATLRTTVYRAVARAGLSDRADLAYWLGVEDGHDGPSRATLAVSRAVDGGALGGGRADRRTA